MTRRTTRPAERVERIPYPNPAERDASIGVIVSRGMPERVRLMDAVVELIRSVGARNLFFGVWDCVFLGVMIALCAWGGLAMAVGGGTWDGDESKVGQVMILLFLISPFLYEFVHLLIRIRERERRTLDLWRVCRWSFRKLAAVRMMAFGAVSVLVNTAGGMLLDAAGRGQLPILTMLGVSFSSLFLFAIGQLAMDARGAWPTAVAVMPVLWALLAALSWTHAGWVAAMLIRLPAAVSLTVAAALAILFLGLLRRFAAASPALIVRRPVRV